MQNIPRITIILKDIHNNHASCTPNIHTTKDIHTNHASCTPNIYITKDIHTNHASCFMHTKYLYNNMTPLYIVKIN